MLSDEQLADLDAYLSARAEVTPEISGDRSPVIHDIDLGSRGHRRLMEPTIPALLAEVRSLRAQRGAVLALHPKVTGNPDRDRPWLEATWCGGCNEGDGGWPCATVRALGVTE